MEGPGIVLELPVASRVGEACRDQAGMRWERLWLIRMGPQGSWLTLRPGEVSVQENASSSPVTCETQKCGPPSSPA